MLPTVAKLHHTTKAILAVVISLPALAWLLVSSDPRPFPICGPIRGETRTWGRLTFLVPAGWNLHHTSTLANRRPGRKDIMLRTGGEFEHYMKSITIAEDPGSDYREAFDTALASGGKLLPDPVPSSIREIKVSGRKAIAFLSREEWQHGYTDTWEVLIDGGSAIFEVGGPGYQRGYERWRDNCAYWAVVKSLRID